MNILYAIFRFLFELVCVGIVGYWGFSRVSAGGWRYLLAVAAPLTVILVWGRWGAPASPNRLTGMARLALELAIYGVGALCLSRTGAKGLAALFAIVAVANALINALTGWLI